MEFLKSVDMILDYNLVEKIRLEHFPLLPFGYIWNMFFRIVIIYETLITERCFVSEVQRAVIRDMNDGVL